VSFPHGSIQLPARANQSPPDVPPLIEDSLTRGESRADLARLHPLAAETPVAGRGVPRPKHAALRVGLGTPPAIHESPIPSTTLDVDRRENPPHRPRKSPSVHPPQRPEYAGDLSPAPGISR